MDIDHEWNGTVVRVFGPWEAVLKSDRGLVPLMEREADLSSCGVDLGGGQGSGSEAIPDPYDFYNWSWLLNLNSPVEPSVILRP